MTFMAKFNATSDQTLKNNLFELRFQISSQMKTEDWEVSKIEKLCKTLKNSKARDECGLIYELFKPPYAGRDIYEPLTKLFNLIKQELVITLLAYTKIKEVEVILAMKEEFLMWQKSGLYLTKLYILMYMKL